MAWFSAVRPFFSAGLLVAPGGFWDHHMALLGLCFVCVVRFAGRRARRPCVSGGSKVVVVVAIAEAKTFWVRASTSSLAHLIQPLDATGAPPSKSNASRTRLPWPCHTLVKFSQRFLRLAWSTYANGGGMFSPKSRIFDTRSSSGRLSIGTDRVCREDCGLGSRRARPFPTPRHRKAKV